jgi:hypothetical protein
MFVATCGGDESLTAPEPDLDSTAPEITITSAPDAGLATEDVSLEWAASDDVGLAAVSISWGVPDSREQLQTTGHSESGSFTHRYEGIGNYTIFLSAHDEAGNTASASHEIAIGRPAPSSPERLVVSTEGSTAIVAWEPGTWATSHEVVVSRLDGSEPDRVFPVESIHTRELEVPDLSWEESYEVRVAALNSLGRAECAPAALQVPPPIPPFFDRFSAAVSDSSCLVVEWQLGPDAAEFYEVVVAGDSEAESFAVTAPLGDWYVWTPEGSFSLEGRFCADEYPVVDGMTYTAQVNAVFGDRSYGSNVRDWTVDFDPVYSTTGTWVGEYTNWESPSPFGLDPSRDLWLGRYTLELVEADGAITGTWEFSSTSSATGRSAR